MVFYVTITDICVLLTLNYTTSIKQVKNIVFLCECILNFFALKFLTSALLFSFWLIVWSFNTIH